ncbi:hypothetical protein ACJIZ3_000971 [Penstemon smallii]|uniref:Uncharacterized protein n=1 Tax=Penstemon smallii TaxID=265156 RepID=A0ABD3U502_9LAMI
MFEFLKYVFFSNFAPSHI